MTKKILVTGAAGFIGYHLCLKLKERGDVVVGYDNFNAYYDPNLKRQRAANLLRSGITILEGDIADKKRMMEIVKGEKISHFAHLAAQAGVRYSLEHPEAYVQANLEGFTAVLEVCRHNDLKLTYASSSSVYGMNDKLPFSEKDRTDHPVSFYGATKKANEGMAFSYHHLYKIPVTGLRYFTVYGPWGRPDMAYYSFANAIMKGEPIRLFNEGKMRRDFTYIDDIIDGTVAAIDLGSPCEIFNLGNHKPEELGLLVSLLEENLGKKAKKELLPMQPGDVLATYADIHHSSEKLGFAPRTSLKDGIAKFCSWFLGVRLPS